MLKEVTQDVLLKVYRKIGAFRGDSALSSWTASRSTPRCPACASTVASEPQIRSVIEPSRRWRRQTTAREDDSRSGGLVSYARRGALTLRIAPGGRDCRPGTARDLPRAVILRDFEGSRQKASTRLKVKDQTLKSRLHRGGRLLLRERLQAFASVWHCTGRRRRARNGSGLSALGTGRYCVETNSGRDDRLASAAASSSARRAT